MEMLFISVCVWGSCSAGARIKIRPTVVLRVRSIVSSFLALWHWVFVILCTGCFGSWWLGVLFIY